MNRFILVTALALLVGCGAALTPAGQGVRVMKADPPRECEEVGPVSANGLGGTPADAIEDAKVRARNKAGELGANYFRWELAQQYAVSGTAYKCPD